MRYLTILTISGRRITRLISLLDAVRTIIFRCAVMMPPKILRKVVDSILTIARKGKAHGVKNINIESIPIIRGRRHELPRNIINLRLKEACVPEGYFFIDNTNITLSDLNEDGIHLNPSGTLKIKLNLLKHVNPLILFYAIFVILVMI